MVTGVTGKEAKDWASNACAATAVRCTPRSAVWTATTSTTTRCATLVRHCLVELDQDGIWLTGGIAEFWSLTTDELKEVTRVAIEEARRVKPGALVQVMSSTDTAKQAIELTLDAQELGADICYILTPYSSARESPGCWSTCVKSPIARTCPWASSTPTRRG